MKISLVLLFGTLLAMGASAAESKPSPFANRDERLQKLVCDVSVAALTQFRERKLQSNQLAITLVDLRDSKHALTASFRGDAPIYPASVVKLFYLAAAYQWLEDGRLKDSDEPRRALRDMIVDSSNDATHYVLDALTETTSGPELPETEMKLWGEKRNSVNRYFTLLGFEKINVNQKPWGDGPYGRDRVWLGKNFENRNALTTDATARLLTEIVLGKCVSTERSAAMMKLLERDPFATSKDSDNQARGFTGMALSPGTKLWSKAGWTSTARHDAACVELPDGRKFVLVTFTTGHASEREIIPFVARRVMAGL